MPACAGPTVAPTVTALIMIAAEMAMMVRLTEDPDISSSLLLRGPRRAAPGQIHSRSVPSTVNCHFLICRCVQQPMLHQGSGYCPNRRHGSRVSPIERD